VPLLYLLVVLFSPLVVDRCDDVVTRAKEARHAIVDEWSRDQRAIQNYRDASREARACLAVSSTDAGVAWFADELFALRLLNDVDGAIAAAEEYVRDYSGIDPSVESYVLAQYGASLLLRSRLTEARSAYERALENAIAAAEPYRVAGTHLHLSELARRMNLEGDVFQHLDEVDRVIERFDFDRADFVRAEVGQRLADALAYFSVKDPERAEVALTRVRESIDWYDAAGLHQRRNMATLSYFALISSVDFTPETYEEALLYFRRHLQDQNSREEMVGLRTLAYFEWRLGMHDLAVGRLEEATRRAGELGEYELQARSASDLGEMYWARGDIEFAKEWLRRSSEIFGLHAAADGYTETALAASRHHEPLRLLALLKLEEGLVHEALALTEEFRTRYLRHLRIQAGPERAGTRVDSLVAMLENVRSKLASIDSNDGAYHSARSREASLLVELTRVVEPSGDELAYDLDAIQRFLRAENKVALSYVVWDASWLNPINYSYAIVVTPDTVAAVRIDVGHDALAEAVSQVIPVSDKPGRGSISLGSMDLSRLKTLYDLLFKPVHRFVENGDRIVVVPDGPLFRVPFSVLVSEHAGRYEYRSARYLMEDHALSHELALSLLLAPGGSPAGRGAFAALARKSHWSKDGDLPNLPAVTQEVRTVGHHFRSTDVLVPDGASRDQLFRSLSDAWGVHVATHAIVHPTSPLYHRILLADDDHTDGTVFMFELLRRAFGTPLVVLSGCATATGPVFGEGMAGFQYGFRAADVGAVVSTHWAAEDQAIAGIMTSFYRELADGIPKDEALRKAQLEYLYQHDGLLASPFLWGNPVVYGDTSPVPQHVIRSSPGGVRPLVAVILFLLFGLLIFVLFRRTRTSHVLQAV